MSLRTPDFESGAYTNFATPASEGHDSLPLSQRQPHAKLTAARIERHLPPAYQLHCKVLKYRPGGRATTSRELSFDGQTANRPSDPTSHDFGNQTPRGVPVK